MKISKAQQEATKTLRGRVMERTVELVRLSPNGMRFKDLWKVLSEEFPDIRASTIRFGITNAATERRGEICRPRVGLYVRTGADGRPDCDLEEIPGPSPEWQFYGSFATWLAEVEHLDKALVLGGKMLGGKWGTPDVFGCISPAVDAIAAYPLVVVAGEVKSDRSDPIPAFGQACSYKEFAHKSWLAVPYNIRTEELERLERLCLMYQIGLALYDPEHPKAPNWTLRVRPVASQPDMGQLNEKLALIKHELW